MSKELFFNMRAEDMALMYNENFTKKDAEKTGINLVNQIYENGDVDPIKVFSNIVRLKEVVNAADKEFRSKFDITEKQTFNGVEFSPKSGSKKLNYDADPVFCEIAQKLKERQELLKVSANSKDQIFDSEGIEVPKVGHTFDKSSIIIKF